MSRSSPSFCSASPLVDAATFTAAPEFADDYSPEVVKVEVAKELELVARELMRVCYDEANRLANHGSNGLEKLVMSQLYDAANAAKKKLNTQLAD